MLQSSTAYSEMISLDRFTNQRLLAPAMITLFDPIKAPAPRGFLVVPYPVFMPRAVVAKIIAAMITRFIVLSNNDAPLICSSEELQFIRF
jgi:hypothetical protein